MKRIIQQLFICCFTFLCFTMLTASPAKAAEEYNENCTLNSVTLRIDEVEHTFTGSLKPYEVPADTNWETFINNIMLTQYSAVTNGTCVKSDHKIMGELVIDDYKQTVLFLKSSLNSKHDELSNYGFSFEKNGLNPDREFIDMVFRFRYHSKENTTEIHVRFVKSYDLTYNLDGGSLPKDSVTSYHSLAETTLPTPEKEGYDFAGWTGEELKTPTKTVTIPTGTTGARSYKANWTKKQTNQTTPPATTDTKKDTKTAPSATTKKLAAGTSVTYQQAVYKITKSNANSAEVTFVSPQNKKVKKIVIPAAIKLSDGRTAKVTGIAKKAFYKCKKLKNIVIRSAYLKKKSIAKNAFLGVSKKTKIKVPKKKKKAYQRWFRTKGLLKKIKLKS